MGSNIIELAKLGHERAAELKASCGAVDVRSLAQLISDLATQLEVQFVRSTNMAVQLANAESKCRELAAENGGLKSEVPMGAIENGRAFADRLDAYQFECQGGNLNMCSDWQELRRCFEHISEWAMHSQAETPATDAFLAEVRAQGVELFAIEWGGHDSPYGQDAYNFADKIRQEAAQ
ncbi:hypothetical protein AN690_0200710 [Citrobacter freundii]|nr:hypothetical protein AN688_0202500 [Citrobacter freundii]OEH35925.1 hypothetical protein AN690_0200710 [Citrobacter freundii]